MLVSGTFYLLIDEMDVHSAGANKKNEPETKGFMRRLAWFVVKGWFFLLVVSTVCFLLMLWLKKDVEVPADTEVVVLDDGGMENNVDQNIPAEVKVPMGKYRPRTVHEMLKDFPEDGKGNEGDSAGVAGVKDVPDEIAQDRAEPNRFEQDNLVPDMEDEQMGQEPEELAVLLKDARYAQIEGDMRKAIVKLEQAWDIAPEHPLVCYYFGQAYEFLRNAAKSREYFAKVVTQREKAGKFYDLAALHLERGFSSPADYRGDISFGVVQEYKEPDVGEGQRVVLTIPVLMKDGLNVRTEDLNVRVDFYELANGKTIEDLRAKDEPQSRWITGPVTWETGEEILECRYYMPPLTEDELIAYGDLKYFGYTAKLYYKGEPMDCRASPPVLLLVEQMRQNSRGYDDFWDEGLLMPAEPATPVADDDEGLAPYDPAVELDDGLLPL